MYKHIRVVLFLITYFYPNRYVNIIIIMSLGIFSLCIFSSDANSDYKPDLKKENSMKISPQSANMIIKQISCKDTQSNFLEITPPLPLAWLPDGNGYVVYYLYELIPLPTGTVQYEIRTPCLQAVLCVSKSESTPSIEGIKEGGKFLGTTTLKDSPDDTYENRLEQAISLLFRLVSSKNTPSAKDREVLRVYLEYVNLNKVIGEYVKNHYPEFFRWLSEE